MHASAEPALQDVPGGDDRPPVLDAQGAERARTRVTEQPAGGRVEAEPAGSEYALEVTVCDKGDVAVVQQRPDPVEHRVRARSHLLKLLARRAAVAGDDLSRHSSQPGLVSWICAAVMPS